MDEAFKLYVKEVVKSRAGRELLWYILELTGLYSCSLTDANSALILEGRRSVGIRILECLEEVDPTVYPHMLLERIKEMSNVE